MQKKNKIFGLEDGALHLQFRGRAFGATGCCATGSSLPTAEILLNLICLAYAALLPSYSVINYHR